MHEMNIKKNLAYCTKRLQNGSKIVKEVQNKFKNNQIAKAKNAEETSKEIRQRETK